jgi:hypothetical protein
VGGLAQTLLLNVCDAPKAQVGQIAPRVPTCLFETSQTPHIGVCAIPKGVTESCFSTNDPGMSMKTKDRCGNPVACGADLQVSNNQ